MLKKAGIVVAIAASSLVAVSPLAFAGDKGHHHGATEITGIDKSGKGLVNVSGNNVNVPVQACNNDVSAAGAGIASVPVQKVAVPVSAALGILGKAKSSSDVDVTDARACGQEAGAGDSVESH